ncbi:hypothetical protein NQZ68_030655 [Dissostichus eleginoides]|nr:hypothetical protein NQZ68_030655 [Dissostichus eleginoides]
MLATSRLHSLPLLCFGGTITVGSIGTVELSPYPASPSTRGSLVYNLLLPPNLESKTEGKASRSCGKVPQADSSMTAGPRCLGVRIEGRGALEIDHWLVSAWLLCPAACAHCLGSRR